MWRGLVIDQKEIMVYHRTSLIVLFAILTVGFASASSVPLDTLMPDGISYSGYRIYIRKVTVLKQKGKEFLLGMEVVNTGKRPISFGPGFPARYLQTRFDESLSSSGLLPLGLQIREGLLNTREKLEVGDWRTDLQLLVRSDVEIEQTELTKDNFERVSSTIQRKSSTPAPSRSKDKSAFAKTTSACVDLVVSEVKVLSKDRKTATVQLTLLNTGGADFDLDRMREGLSLTMFLSGSPRLSSSSKKLRRIRLADRLASQGQTSLSQGENIVLVEQVDVSKATRYTGVLIAQLDSGQVVEECNETNNEGHALLFD